MTDCIKAYTVRLYTHIDLDLIEKAILNSGIPKSEWLRNSLILCAEVEVKKGGLSGLTYKNVLATRYLQQQSGQYSKEQIHQAKAWARSEFDRLFGSQNHTGGSS